MALTNFPHGLSVINQETTAGGVGLSPLIWGDCPILGMLADPGIGLIGGDDFTGVQTTGFPYAIAGANGTFLAVPAVQYGEAKLLATGADNDECFVTTGNNLAGMIKADTSKSWWFEAKVKISQITLAQGVFVGLAEETGVGTDFMTDNTMAMKVIDSIGFQIIAATDIAAIWQTVMHLTGGARVAISAAAATASVSYVKLGMKSTPNEAGTVATVRFYVNGVALTTSTTTAATNFPLNQVMQVTFATKCGQGTANSMTLDWWRAAQLR
jgi:hypothetical protein